MLKYVLIIIYLVVNTLAIILMKFGGDSTTMSIKAGNFSLSMSLVSMLGYICYIISFLFWTKLITMFDLSYIVPIVMGISQVLILLIALGVFHESISVVGVIGIILVIAGIICINIK